MALFYPVLLFTTKVTLIQGTHNLSLAFQRLNLLLFTTKVTLIQGTHNRDNYILVPCGVVVHHEGNSYSRNSQPVFVGGGLGISCCSPRR